MLFGATNFVVLFFCYEVDFTEETIAVLTFSGLSFNQALGAI